MTEDTEFTPPSDAELVELRAEHAAYMDDFRARVSLEGHGPCGAEGCGHALAFHDPCSRCPCTGFVGADAAEETS